MRRYRERPSAFFTRFAHHLGRKQRSVIGRSSVPQTSPIFKLPDEIILSILSHISPDPWLAGDYARFWIAYCVGNSVCHHLWVQFLRPLSMTCRAMRLRLLPWVWERLTVWGGLEASPWLLRTTRNFNAIVLNAFRTNPVLATNVRFVTVYFPGQRDGPISPLFVKCLTSLPNLHTLEVGPWGGDTTSIPLKKVFIGVKLPQIKTLIIPPAAHPLLQHCQDVEDVICVIIPGQVQSFDGLLGSLASNQDSKVKRLAIPLALWPNPNRFVAACPRLTELTVFPYPYDVRITETEILHDPAGKTLSALSELVSACESLPDFDTIQILYFPAHPHYRIQFCWKKWCSCPIPCTRHWEKSLKEQGRGMKDFVVDRLRSKVGCQEGDRGKKRTVRVVRLNPVISRTDFSPGSVEVEECEV